ncbi:winged helix-turn-helix transcriptional regulator [bacterium]|nr:winged helix-turn-helix transcriptional regulator [bacterium]
MTVEDTAKAQAGAKSALKTLRERRGGVPRELLDANKETVKTRKAVIDALAGGPKTALQIAAQTGLPSQTVFWHLMSMKKYGKVAEGEADGDYFTYGLVEEK